MKASLLLVVALCCTSYASGAEDAASEFTLKDAIEAHGAVGSWSVDTVGSVLHALGFSADAVSKATRHGIDGSMLFELDDASLAFLKFAPADKRWFQTVIKSATGSTQTSSGLQHADLWDVRAMNRNYFHTLLWMPAPIATFVLKIWYPGFDELFFGASGPDGGAPFSWTTWLLCPAWIVWCYLRPFLDTNPVLVLVLMYSYLQAQISTYKSIGSVLLQKRTIAKALGDLFSWVWTVFLGIMFHYYIFFPLTPRFLTNGLFYLYIGLTVGFSSLQLLNLIGLNPIAPVMRKAVSWIADWARGGRNSNGLRSNGQNAAGGADAAGDPSPPTNPTTQRLQNGSTPGDLPPKAAATRTAATPAVATTGTSTAPQAATTGGADAAAATVQQSPSSHLRQRRQAQTAAVAAAPGSGVDGGHESEAEDPLDADPVHPASSR